MPVYGIPESKIWGIISVGFAVLTVAATTYWAQPNPMNTAYSQTGFLNSPDWETQRISMHIVLMTAGFLVAQMFGGVVWVFFSSKIVGLLIHLLFETAGLICMALGLLMAVNDKNVSNTAHLTTFHSWVGVSCIGVYSITYLYGFVLGVLPYIYKQVDVKSLTNLRGFHAMLGQISLYLSIASVLTGIMEQFAITGCDYVGLTLNAPDINPGANYYAIPDSCKIGNGVGIFALFGTITTFITIYYRKNVVITRINTALGNKRRQYTMNEVASHNTTKSAWIIVKGHVYDCTTFLSQHPGGASSILNHAGEDCTEEFDSIHSKSAWEALENFYIGDVSDSEPLLNSQENGAAKVDEFGNPIALGKNVYTAFPLQEKISVSHDTIMVRFGLPSVDHVLGLPLGQHILLQSTIKGESVARAYTPTSSNLQKGYFELVVKVYHANTNPAFPNGGKLSQFINNMKIGDTINVKGPTGHVTYLGRGNIQLGKVKHEVKNFVMIAAGSGITPMYQIASAILRDTEDKTKCHLLFANRTEYDILLINELDALAARHPDRFYIYHVLSRPKNEEAWRETGHFSGYASEQIISQIFPKGGKNSKNMALLCGPKGFTEDTCPKALKSIGYTDSSIVTF